jgi:hypothetical protein
MDITWEKLHNILGEKTWWNVEAFQIFIAFSQFATA